MYAVVCHADEHPCLLQERLSVRREPSQEKLEQRRAPPEPNPDKKNAVTDLRDLLSRNKRSRDGERDEAQLRPGVKSRISRE